MEGSGRTDISNERCMAGYKLELLKLFGKIAKHAECYKTKCRVFRLFNCCQDNAAHSFPKDCFQMLYLQVVGGPKGESWSKTAQSDLLNKGR